MSAKSKQISESLDTKYIRKFVECLCEGHLADANKALKSAMYEKLRNRVKSEKGVK